MNKPTLLPSPLALAAIAAFTPFRSACAQSNDASASSNSSGDKYSLAQRLGDPQLNNVGPKNKNVGGGPGNSGPGDKNPAR